MFKTEPRQHQLEALNRSQDAAAFALLMEQGTGKSKVAIDTAAYLYGQGKIELMVILGPLSAAINWPAVELPKHMPDAVNASVLTYRLDRVSTKKWQHTQAEWLATPLGLRVLVLNFEALRSEKAFHFLKKMLQTFPTLLILDESSFIKNHRAKVTKLLLRLAIFARFRRILTGTPLTQSPLDFYTQFAFLDEAIIGESSAYAFNAQYSELVDRDAGIMHHLWQRGVRYLPQIVAKDETGRPKFKNLEQLAALVAPHSFRIRKTECLDLPPKVYERWYTTLTPQQHAPYQRLEQELRIQLEDNSIKTVTQLTSLLKLQQLLSGIGDFRHIPTNRYQDFVALIESLTGQVIVWARFVEEIENIVQCLTPASIVTYYGATSRKNRAAAQARFQNGEAQFFVGQPHSGGYVLTLTAASHVIYFSNDFSLQARLQSEDRAHRIGQEKSVTIWDLVAEDTIDEKLIMARERKEELSIQLLRRIEEVQ